MKIPEPSPGPEQIALDHEAATIARERIGKLPEHHRTFLTLRVADELDYEEIAEFTHSPIGTVKSGISRAAERLRRSYIDSGRTYQRTQVKTQSQAS